MESSSGTETTTETTAETMSQPTGEPTAADLSPRPERPVFVADYESSIPFYASRHLVRPGVTGWAQVNYGYADDQAETVEKLTYDLFYIKHSSFWLDLRIIGMSVWTVLTGFGAR